MKVKNMVSSSSGRQIPNQFIIADDEGVYLQSYSSIIVFKPNDCGYTPGTNKRIWGKIELDKRYWDYSRTTGRYRNQFLGETKRETEAKIKSGEYILADLN